MHAQSNDLLQVIKLPAWQTPEFCREALQRHAQTDRYLSADQILRYQAIANGVDWKVNRGAKLTWEEDHDAVQARWF